MSIVGTTLPEGITAKGEGVYEVVPNTEFQIQATVPEHYHFDHWADLTAEDAMYAANPRTIVAGENLTVEPFYAIDTYIVTLASNDETMGTLRVEGASSEESSVLSGKFSVAGDKVVYFSKANLQYQASTNTWQFAENQYDMIGSDNSNISASYSGWIDLFGWGTGANPTKTSTSSSDYSTFTDWGVNMISNGGNEANLWRTLTTDEWVYLCNTRTVNGGTGNGKSYTLGQSVNGTLGIVLYPDNYTGDIYAGSDWSTFEAAGCVFLPAAGYRRSTGVFDVGSSCNYWSATPFNAEYSYGLFFTSSSLFPQLEYDRGNGHSIRLVTETAPAAQQGGQAEPITVTITKDDFSGNISNSITKDGVTVSAEMLGSTYIQNGTFSTTLGNFIQIEVQALEHDAVGDGWIEDGMKWVGNASSVSFNGYYQDDDLTYRFTIEPTAAPAASGIVDNGDGTYTVDWGTEMSIIAEPKEGYMLASWNGEPALSDTLKQTVEGALSVNATFKHIPAVITLPEGVSIVAPVPAGITDKGEGVYEVVPNTEFQIQATVPEHYHFDHWADLDAEDAMYAANPRTIVAGENLTVEPIYAIDTYVISLASNDETMGTLRVEGASSAESSVLSGQFSVADGKVVYFSKANLQYDIDNTKWQLAEDQWSIIGDAAGNNTSDGDHTISGVIDLFGWGVAATDPTLTTQNNSFYLPSVTADNAEMGTANDWGTVAASDLGSGWRTLTKDEWGYLFSQRANCSALHARATVHDVAGMILLPDGCTAPAVTLDATATDYTTNVISDNNWEALAAQGAVFLPAAGYRYGTSVGGVGSYGDYWSSTSGNSNYGYDLYFSASYLGPQSLDSRCSGRSVRLGTETTQAEQQGGQAEPITVTWNNSDISGSGNSFTKDGVTITCGGINWGYPDFYGPGTFTTDLGNFTKIEVTADMFEMDGAGWTEDYVKQTWTGNAASVSFNGGMYIISSIVFTIEPTAAPAASGIVDNGDGTYTVDWGTEMSIIAEPKEGYMLASWNGEPALSDTLTVTVEGALSINATFKHIPAVITLPEGVSIVAPVPAGITAKGEGVYEVEYGTEFQIEGTAPEHYHFDHWADLTAEDAMYTINPRTIVAGENLTVEPFYAIDTYVISLASNDETMGTLRIAGAGEEGGLQEPFAQLIVPESWSSEVGVTITAADLPGFVASTEEAVKALPVPTEGSVFVIYNFKEEVDPSGGAGNVSVEAVTFENGEYVRTTSSPVDHASTSYYSKQGMTYFYTTAAQQGGQAEPITVTITNQDFPEVGNSFTKDGVTVSAGTLSANYIANGTFSTTLGNITKIEVTADERDASGDGWVESGKTWTGNASSVPFSGYYSDKYDIVGIKFVITIEPTTVSGIVDNGDGTYTVDWGTELTFVAQPAERFMLESWSNGAPVNGDSLTITVTEPLSLTANFKHIPAVITLPEGVSIVAPVPAGITAKGEGVYEVEYGTEFQITAVGAPEHYHFDHWADLDAEDAMYAANPRTIVAGEDLTVEPFYAIDTYVISLASNDETMGTLRVEGVGEEGEEPFAQLIVPESWSSEVGVTITADDLPGFVASTEEAVKALPVPTEGSVFVIYNFKEEVDPSGGAGNASVEAVTFENGEYVRTTSSPVDHASTSYYSKQGMTYFYTTAAQQGGQAEPIIVTITNQDFPEVGNSFTKDGVTVSAGTLSANYIANGTFSTTLGNITGIEVTADERDASGDGWVEYGKTWTGNASSVSFSGYYSDKYDIVGIKFVITIEPTTVSGIVDNGDGTYTVDWGTEMSIIAEPKEGYMLASWSNGAPVNGDSLTITVTEPLSLTANFKYIPAVITLPEGVNIVEPVPAGITALGEGVYEVEHGTEFQITAVGAPEHYHFDHWADLSAEDAQYYANPRTVVADTNFTANPFYTIDTYVITLASNDETMGTLTVEPAEGIVDNGDGTYTIDWGTEVTFVAVPAEDYHLLSWSNGAEVTEDNKQTLTVTEALSLSAFFKHDTYILTVEGVEVKNAKFADGTADAEVLNPGTLVGVQTGDNVQLTTTATFSSAAVGDNLTITVHYAIEVIDGGIYDNEYALAITDSILEIKGFILEPMTPDEEAAPEDQEADNKEGFDIYAYGYCKGDNIGFKFHLNSGKPDQYKVEFADSRFTDIDWTNLEMEGKDGEVFIDIPMDMPTGDYSMTVTFRDSRFTFIESDPITVPFHVNLPETYVVALFDNVMAVVDTCECLTDIQWYHRADASQPWTMIEGATGYYYQQVGGLSGEYFIHAKMNGVDTYTCPQDDMTLYGDTKQAKVRAYPNPVVNTTTVTIENSYNYEHTLRVVNFNGWEVLRSTFEGNETKVDMGGYMQGNYMISVDGIVVKVMKK